jgi:hypothetical protein
VRGAGIKMTECAALSRLSDDSTASTEVDDEVKFKEMSDRKR